jgi:hypothetical protein
VNGIPWPLLPGDATFSRENVNPNQEEHAMKLSSAQIAQALDNFEADVVPENNPVIPQLTRLFGEHTYFLDQTGLNIVEPAGSEQQDGREGPMGVVVNIANWTGEGSTSLVPHEPQTTSVLVPL